MYKMNHCIKLLLPLIVGLLLIIGIVNNISSKDSTASDVQVETEKVTIFESNYVKVKYREDPVDICHPRFEHLDTSKSSFVRGAWYDKENSYLVIKLKETYYHYCGMPLEVWTNFKKVDSFGTFYNLYIKGHYDCRINYVPIYDNTED